MKVTFEKQRQVFGFGVGIHRNRIVFDHLRRYQVFLWGIEILVGKYTLAFLWNKEKLISRDERVSKHVFSRPGFFDK